MKIPVEKRILTKSHLDIIECCSDSALRPYLSVLRDNEKPGPKKNQIRWACTIGPVDAGIVDALERTYAQKTGVTVSHVSAGSSEALRLAKSGYFDLVLVHAENLEKQFVDEGFGTERIPFMYNDFVLIGPGSDPAGIKSETSILRALKKIKDKPCRFVSRGDKSGTHIKELELWEAANLQPSGDWYQVCPHGASGNAQTLIFAGRQLAYTIIDRATYITNKPNILLELLLENDELLLNYITLIPVSPKKFPHINAAGAKNYIQWLTSEEGQLLIRDFGKSTYGEPLYFPNSPLGRKLK